MRLCGLLFLLGISLQCQSPVHESRDNSFFQSQGNAYWVKLDHVRDSIQLIGGLQEKTFKLNEGNPREIFDPQLGHTFYFQKPHKESVYLIQVKGKTTDSGNERVNIQVFKWEADRWQRFFNPGDFDLTAMKERGKMNSEWEVLRDLIVTLTYK